MARSHSWEAMASSAWPMASSKVSRAISSAFTAALGLYFLSRASASFLCGEAYLTTRLVASMILRTARGRSALVASGIWASMFLASSIKTPNPSGDRCSSRRL